MINNENKNIMSSEKKINFDLFRRNLTPNTLTQLLQPLGLNHLTNSEMLRIAVDLYKNDNDFKFLIDEINSVRSTNGLHKLCFDFLPEL